ncbi:hypothetical protein GMORB2_1841 [Geosmithia morbida]|uniref:Uncharacterized protein n=1 Tax=Geosmithia morbida TaxID=1094350 RepID=A0A9P4YTD9_9HYPO|nr:uncharacterized protein GMORB2_1841 [Geosmithia morbida]KAF4121434.1 hypothetical protein GMORB2_1841 [Geosmithia morbida]
MVLPALVIAVSRIPEVMEVLVETSCDRSVSSSPRVGQSFRYKERDGIWQYEQVRIPSADKPSRVPVEDSDRIVLALHIENMAEDMESMLGETLSPRRFHHSLSTRSVSSSNGRRHRSTSSDPLEGKGRSRHWLGHALVVLNEAGFIGLKEGTPGVGLVEREALHKARANISSTPIKRTVSKTNHAIFDSNGIRQV